MINPIHKALSVIQTLRLRYLLMGGQACILYGGAEFSRDIDLAILPSPENLDHLHQILETLQATRIAVPPFDTSHLLRGHAIHFRCAHPEARDLRIDIMATMRGLDPFETLWQRRTTIQLQIQPDLTVELLGLPDLIRAKKTQRDKDWPMIRRLIEADYARAAAAPTEPQIRFWLRESRTPAILQSLASDYPDHLQAEQPNRPLLALAKANAGTTEALDRALLEEELQERERDRQYWKPLRQELEKLRHQT